MGLSVQKVHGSARGIYGFHFRDFGLFERDWHWPGGGDYGRIFGLRNAIWMVLALSYISFPDVYYSTVSIATSLVVYMRYCY